MRKILIATSNVGKFKEITCEFSDLPFEFLNLKDLKLNKFEVDEDQPTIWQNALKKAEFFAKKSGLLTIAEDTGFFVDYLNGEPGMKAKRYAPTAGERNKKIIELLINAPLKKRTARFETAGCVYDPDKKSFSLFFGKVSGLVSKKISKSAREGMGYDSIFYYPPLRKNFVDISIFDKNLISHRGQVINQMKTYLMNYHNFRQIVAPAAIIVKNRKMLLTKRRDARPQFNGKWEFPGGGVEPGEEIMDCLKREVKEETGYSVEAVEMLPDILSNVRDDKFGNYQVFLMLYICRIKSGKYSPSDAETSGYGWYAYNQAAKADLLPLNKKSIQSKNNKNILKKYID